MVCPSVKSVPVRANRRGALALFAAALGSAACAGPISTKTQSDAPLASAAPSQPLPQHRPSLPSVLPDVNLMDTTFRQIRRFRPFELVAPAFTLASAQYDSPVSSRIRKKATLPAPFLAVEVQVRNRVGHGVITAGLVSSKGPQGLSAQLDPDKGVVSLVLTTKRGSVPLGSSQVRISTGSFAMGFVLCENQATVLVRPEDGVWEPLITERTKVLLELDFRDPEFLDDLEFEWGVVDGTRNLGTVRAGLFGMAGLRDPHLVQHADGTPFLRNGKAFLTWTCAGLGSFQQAHWGVFELDLDKPQRMRQVAQIYTHRGNKRLGDHAGQLVRDGNKWLVANSSWGDFNGSGVHIRHTETTADLLSGVHVLNTEPVKMPTRLNTWDPSFTRIDGRWHMAYVESPSVSPFIFYPALAVTTRNSPFSGLTRVGSDARKLETEGTILTRDRSGWFVLASDGDARRFPVYDLNMREIGVLNAAYDTNIPHPQVIPHNGRWVMVSFNGANAFEKVVGYGAHGDVVIRAGSG